MKFPYRLYGIEPSPAAPDKTIITRPVIPVRFTGARATMESYALLDTGADETYITQEMADKLGVKPLSGAAIVESASGEMSIVYGEVLIEVDDGIEFFSRRVTVGIVVQTWSEAILGHIGFLEHFDATFSYAEKTVILTAIDDLTDVEDNAH